ncbi:MAG: cysteine desulfurase [Pseudomonadales bacterium]|nr:cysteine desulfurase [Pseudomonadales bacterium]
MKASDTSEDIATSHLPEENQIKPFDVAAVRADFPILHQKINGKSLVYLDNAATTQKPQSVLDVLHHYYSLDNANVHRGAHQLSDRATESFENARRKVQRFLNAAKPQEIIWSKGTTESINMVAHCYGKSVLTAGDEVIVSAMEHHSNIVPWQMVCEQTGAHLKVIPVNADGELQFDEYVSLLNERTKIVSVVHVSNALGSVNPIKAIAEKAHEVGAKVVVDGAQAVAHWNVDVQDLDCDFYAFSGHKLFAPTGIGVLYGKQELLEAMPPYQGGGEMIEKVSFAGTTYNELPYKFEAGTPHIAGAIGLGAAIDYLDSLDRQAMASHEADLLSRAQALAASCDGIELVGVAKDKVSVMSFLLEGAHPQDVGMLLDQQGIAVRTGHHCAMPIMEQYKIPGTVRASFTFYNTLEEVEALFTGIEKVKTFL